MSLLRFTTLDVFTGEQFGGNPLAIVHGADNLDPAQMQAIASEFNLSETVFVLRPSDETRTARLRIFTPRAELPFAGHPNIGAGYVLAREAERRGKEIPPEGMLFEEICGLVRVKVLRESNQIAGAQVAAPQKLRVGTTLSPDIVGQLCGAAPSNIEQSRHLPCFASVGVPFVFVQLKTREALANTAPAFEAFERNLPQTTAAGLFLYVRTPESDPPIQARMFAPLLGVHEDAATGAANLALAGLLAHLNHRPDLLLKTRIGQGSDMGRPSILEIMAVKKNGLVTATYVGGRCVPVMKGTMTLD